MAGSSPINVSSPIRGAAIATINGATLWAREVMNATHAPIWKPENTQMDGSIDKYKADFVIRHNIMLYGLFKDISALFPSYALNPVTGTNIFSTDNPFVYWARNGDKITYWNSQITKLFGLWLGVDGELFSSAVEITSIIRSGYLPSDADAYFTRDNVTFVSPTFSNAARLRKRWTATWGTKAGFATFIGKKGFNIDWNLDIQPDLTEGFGTTGMFIGQGVLVGNMKCIPMLPTPAQVDTAQNLSADLGSAFSDNVADLSLVADSNSIVLKSAGITSNTTSFGIQPLRQGEIVWETVHGFVNGQPQAVATITSAND